MEYLPALDRVANFKAVLEKKSCSLTLLMVKCSKNPLWITSKGNWVKVKCHKKKNTNENGARKTQQEKADNILGGTENWCKKDDIVSNLPMGRRKTDSAHRLRVSVPVMAGSHRNSSQIYSWGYLNWGSMPAPKVSRSNPTGDPSRSADCLIAGEICALWG